MNNLEKAAIQKIAGESSENLKTVLKYELDNLRRGRKVGLPVGNVKILLSDISRRELKKAL